MNVLNIVLLIIFSALVLWGLMMVLNMMRPHGFWKFFFFEKGDHRSSLAIYPTINSNKFRVLVELSEELFIGEGYPLWEKEQINKIYGLSLCLFPRIRIIEGKLKYFAPHHWNSIRIGFNTNYENQTFNIYSYTYHKGKRHSSKIKEVKPKEAFEIDSTRFGGLVHPEKSILGYHLWPYIGGEFPARRDALIKIKVLNLKKL